MKNLKDDQLKEMASDKWFTPVGTLLANLIRRSREQGLENKVFEIIAAGWYWEMRTEWFSRRGGAEAGLVERSMAIGQLDDVNKLAYGMREDEDPLSGVVSNVYKRMTHLNDSLYYLMNCLEECDGPSWRNGEACDCTFCTNRLPKIMDAMPDITTPNPENPVLGGIS